MHEVYFNTQVNAALRVFVYTNVCLQCYLKGPVDMNTEYILVAQQKRIGQARKKRENKILTK